MGGTHELPPREPDAIVPGRIPDDVEACIGLWLDALRHRDGSVDAAPVAERMRRLLQRRIVRFAVVGRPITGFALTVAKPGDERIAVLERIAVHPRAAGRGIGRALLDDAVASAAAGHDAVELAVRIGNPATRLYEAAGFRAASAPVPHELGGAPMVTYRLELGGPGRGPGTVPDPGLG